MNEQGTNQSPGSVLWGTDPGTGKMQAARASRFFHRASGEVRKSYSKDHRETAGEGAHGFRGYAGCHRANI